MNPTTRTFASLDPATGKESARYPIHDAEHVRTRRLFRTPLEPTSFARTQGTMRLLDRYVSLRFGRRC